MESNGVRLIRQQREMAGRMKLPATLQLELLKKEKRVGTARVGCRHYKYDPMLSIEYPKGFCRHNQLFAKCGFTDNPELCPHSGPDISGNFQEAAGSPIVKTIVLSAKRALRRVIPPRKKRGGNGKKLQL